MRTHLIFYPFTTARAPRPSHFHEPRTYDGAPPPPPRPMYGALYLFSARRSFSPHAEPSANAGARPPSGRVRPG
ncbi:hypothetical protein EYF80_052762 [Liparis tanakae]|uniref:Uncharacterized protein n=1 Tax=Liparis tanakae TaxID=230148 RepID=A0A4Z2F744_9TELE|nr:hypothetical protein EYF80_052762 [Liparis tanakae]